MLKASMALTNSDKGYFGGSWCDGCSHVPMSWSSFVSFSKTSCIYFSTSDPDKEMTIYFIMATNCTVYDNLVGKGFCRLNVFHLTAINSTLRHF